MRRKNFLIKCILITSMICASFTTPANTYNTTPTPANVPYIVPTYIPTPSPTPISKNAQNNLESPKYSNSVVSNEGKDVSFIFNEPIHLDSCSACNYSRPNFGAAFLFDTDYTYNVSGVTGPALSDQPTEAFYEKLSANIPIGIAYLDECVQPIQVLLGDYF